MVSTGAPKGISRGKETTPKQKAAVDNVLSGQYKYKGKNSIRASMMAAGFSEATSGDPTRNLAERQGVQIYLEKLGEKAKKKFGMELRDKVMETYLDGLEATKLMGKDSIEHPDYSTRLAFADRFSDFFGWLEQRREAKAYNQYNFFSVNEKERAKFNTNFKGFLDKYYKK